MDIFGDTAYSAYMLPAHILLLPQSTQGALELWAIQDSPNYQSGPELFLLLPTLERAPGFQYLFDKLDYTPKGHRPTNRGSQRFHSSYDESVLAFDLTCGDVEGGTMCLEWLVVMSRKALLQLLSLSGNRGTKLTWDRWISFTSRWLSTDGVNYTWPANICGQRIVFVTHEGSIRLFDFNEHRCSRKNLTMQGGDEEEPIDDEGEDLALLHSNIP
ncbi:hypothetical protein R3P38DRAFT_127771 [Favolaschia claudopus]|uniref:Uncharacterized protein n=1 Tax=Favolaschia claudopus TaxID=2862362 RepID=A0AAV9ZW16_9AGAR